MSFSVSGEHVNFDARGDSVPSYDLINWQRQTNGDINFVKVGLYDGARDAGNELVIQDQAVVWADNQSKARCSVFCITVPSVDEQTYTEFSFNTFITAHLTAARLEKVLNDD